MTLKLLAITQFLNDNYDKIPIEDVYSISAGIVSTLGNILLVCIIFKFLSDYLNFYTIFKGLSNSLNLRLDYLLLDITAASSNPYYYDTDLDNFWTNISISTQNFIQSETNFKL